MGFSLEHASRNVHVVRFEDSARRWTRKVLAVSDQHWDNPDCDRDMMKRHYDEAMEINAPIVGVGDFFCAMQGKYDKRSDKSKVRPEHQCGDYLDALVRTAADWLEPYAANLVNIGVGNHECLDGESEVLTDKGWVPIPDITVRHRVAMMHPHDQSIVYASPTRTHAFDYEGDMVRVSSRTADMMMTPNHRVAYFRQNSGDLAYMEASEIVSIRSGAYSIPTGGVVAGEETGLTDDQIELAAWMMTDGSFSGGCMSIYQSKPKTVLRIRALLDRMGIEFSEYVDDRNVDSILGVKVKSCRAQHTFRIKKASHGAVRATGVVDKSRLPSWVWRCTRREFDHFLDGLILGDGSRHKSSVTSMMLYGTKEFLDEVQRACVTHGHRAVLAARNRKGKFSYWCLNITPRTSITLRSEIASLVPYIGKVYCLTTPAGNFVMRRNGKVCVTGNSALRQRHETDVSERLAQTLRDRTGCSVEAGGYGGWVRFMFKRHNERCSIRAHYFHGSGGGGPVTKGVIQTNRRQEMADADIYLGGHVHESWAVRRGRCFLNENNTVVHRNGLHVCIPGYKDEYKDGHGGWHVETGKGPKPKGAYWIEFDYNAGDIQFRAIEAN